jgi:poly(A) polymerase
VRTDLSKLLLAPRPSPTLAIMAETGLLGLVLGGVALLASFENMVKIEAAMSLQADAMRRLGALGVAVREDGERLAQTLRLSNAETERLVALDGWWRVTPAAGEKSARALLYRLGPQCFSDQVLLAWSRSGAGVADFAWRGLAGLPETWSVPAFPLKAADFIRRGIAAGPALGAALRAAEKAWIAADFPTDRAAIELIADQAARDVTKAS